MTALPATIGPFRITSVLGRGGMGVVYRACGPAGEAVAVKTVRAPDADRLQSIRREIAALAKLRHPGIVRVVDHGVEGSLPWYAMELLEDESLAGLATATSSGSWPTEVVTGSGSGGAAPAVQAPVPPARLEPDRLAWALTMLRRLCFPLAYLHGEGVVHRDLKPENVVVRRGWPVLVDFGLSSRFAAQDFRESLEVPGEIAGTVVYMSPEQCRGEIPDARSDLYALGCVLHVLLTGRPPFVADHARELWRMHLQAEPPPLSAALPGAPDAVEEIAARLLAKSPRDRYGHADALAAALLRAGAEEGEPAGAPRTRAYLYRPGLTGRASLHAEIGRWLRADARGGEGQLRLLAGESGIGKTRLALEAAGDARREGWQVFAGSCSAPAERGRGGGLEPLLPLLVAVADRCREGGGRVVSELLGGNARVLAPFEPALGSLAGVAELPPLEEIPEAQARARVRAAVVQLLAALSRRAGLLLVLDDLQWCDEGTRDLVDLAASSGLPARVRVLGTIRRDEGPLLLSGGWQAALRSLERLDVESLAALVCEMLGSPEPPAGFVRTLADRSGGNPYFVCEYLRMAVDEGILRRDATGRWEVGSGYERLPEPGSLQELARRRIEGLSGGALAAASLLAVLGRQAPAPLLRGLLGVEAEPEVVRELIVRDVVEEAPGETLRFVHDQLRIAAYERLSGEEGTAHHDRCARAVQAAGGSGAGMTPLGRHWEKAGDWPAARAAYAAQAWQAARQHALEEAEELVGSLLALAPPLEERLEARLLLAVGVHAVRGRTAEAIAQLELAREEAAGGAAPGRRIARELAALLSRTGPLERAVGLAEEALEESRAAGDNVEEAHALRLLARLRNFEGRGDEAETLRRDALATARRVGDRHLESMTLSEMANAMRMLHRPDEARRLYGEALALHRELGARRAESSVLGNMASLAWSEGALAEARELSARALAIARETGDRPGEGFLRGGLGNILWAEERHDEAAESWSASLEIAEEGGDLRQQATLLGNLCTWELRAGRPAEARERCLRSLELARAMSDRAAEADALALLAETQQACGEAAEARSTLEAAIALAAEVGEVETEATLRRALAALDGPAEPPAAG